ncbi:WhiB family transcriptional regulator [Streptomyces chartreusis]|uniref:WhiB family transcriptional regulator n=1 Tax=Streptomyces chartreusis TaxID=1969 RepID=UPI0034381729
MSSSIASRLDPKAANEALTDHPHYKYRGCASDPDDPRMSAGDPDLSVDAWQAPDVDGGEDQEERAARVEAAKAVCRRCPVLEACAAYGASVGADEKLAERHAILGGLTAVERTKALVQERQALPVVVAPAPDQELRTPQKLAVLRAWAAHESPEGVAAAAGMDLRTANWQRARITTQLGLSKSASRTEVLEAAVARGLLRPDEVAVEAPVVVSVPGGRRAARGRRVTVAPGQLSFFDAGPAMEAAA